MHTGYCTPVFPSRVTCQTYRNVYLRTLDCLYKCLYCPHPLVIFTELAWRAKVSPPDHPVAEYEFDVLVGADGKRNTLEGMKHVVNMLTVQLQVSLDCH